MKISTASATVRKSFVEQRMVFEIRLGNEERTLQISHALDEKERFVDHIAIAKALRGMARALEAL